MILGRFQLTFDEDEQDLEKWDNIIKLRVVDVITIWAEQFWSTDFHTKENRNYFEMLIKMISNGKFAKENFIQSKFSTIKANLNVLLESGVGSKSSALDDSESIPMSISSASGQNISPNRPNTNFIDLDPEEFTMVMYQKEINLLSALNESIFALHLWGSRKDPIIQTALKPIDDLVDHFNQVSYWVATEICTQPGIN
jgi:hypothetical protein